MMPKFFIAYCAVLLVLLALANHFGIIYSSYLFGENAQAAKSANLYHK